MAQLVRELLDRDPPGLAGGSLAGGGLAGYELADRILRREGGFSTFLTLLADAMSERIRESARRDDAGSGGRLEAWDALHRLRAEAERFNLDKRQALLSSLELLSER